MNRRGFLKSLGALGAAAWLAPQVAISPAPTGLQSLVLDAPTTGTIGAINRATYTFWRAQSVDGKHSRPVDLAMMREAFDKCA